MAQDKVKALYDTFVKEGYNMESEAEFRKNLADPAKRKAAYEALKNDGYEMEAYDAFETNIGYGKTQPTSAPTATSAPQPQADVKTTPAPAAPQPQSAPTPAPAPKATQPTWKPSEQDKIRMSWGLFNMLNDFRQQSQVRIEQARRATMPMTTEGRRKLKAGKFQAQLAGTPTKMMGLTPNVRTAETATAGEGQGAAETTAKPLESAQSPVPYGVRYVNGKPVTEWLLPDGTLTTDLVEADKAEYGARTVRLRNQFVDRMKQNGLDPSKQEDVQKQSQIDAETEEAKFIERTSEDANNVVAELWQEAEEKHKADKNANADREWSRYAAMGGGREMRVVTASANRHADQVSHMTRFDLEKMMETTWARVGNRVTAQCYNRLRTQYPQATEEELQKAATDMARGLTDNAVFQYAVKQNTPKSTLEYFGRTVADANILNSIGKGLARSQAGTSGDLAAYEQTMGEYGKNHRVAQIGGTVVGMAIDPVTYISGGMGSLFGKGAIWAGGRFLASRAAGMSTQVGTRLFSSSLSGRLLTGAAAGAGNFMTFETLKEAENQFLHGGHINEQGENEGYSAQAILKSAGKGLILGGVTGTMTPLLGNVTDKAVKATESTAGKVGLRATELGVSTIAEGTVFALPEWYENSKREDDDPNKRTIMDIWTDNMAMMLGFKVSHGIKSAPRVIASLRPIKPAGGRPLTQAERNHNRMNFEERVRKSMDMSPNDLSFSDDEREELRRAGYGELADIFSRDHEQPTSQPNPADGAIELRTERADAEEIRNGNPEFDGYSDMERLMRDGRVSQAARAKAYYVLTGRMLPMGTVTGWTKDIADDGRVTINAVTADGEVVTSRTFANEKAAEQETDNISRQAELNSVDVGERYREALADEMLLEEAISQVSPGADMETVKRIYRAVKAGNKDMTEDQAALAGFIDEAIERNRDMADRHRPEAIRAELREEFGIDVDDALRKIPGKRTAKEQELVKTYLERLFPEEARERAEEPTPEQEEAHGLYEEGKLLYGRYEEGDPNVTAEVDAIVLRMQEANQIFEDAFGAESEYYRFHLNENPWGLINDPALTAEQQDALLYYINSKAALDGVMDASHEASQRKREQVEQEVAKRTHKDTGVITPATMKVNDRQVYIVKGDVAMYPDGSGVDAHNSSESVVVMDAESGEYEFTSPDQIFSVGGNIDPEDELQTAYAQIDAEQESVFGVDVPPEPEAPAEPAPEAEAPQQPIAHTEEYDRAYEQGLQEAANAGDAWIANLINIYSQNTPESMPEAMKGRLDAYRYEQQRRQMEPQNAPAEVAGNNGTENIPENGNIDAENIPAPADRVQYDQGYEYGLNSVQSYSDERLNSEIEKLRGGADLLTDFGRGMLEAMEYVQQERAMAAESVPENAESVPNIGENTEIPTENSESSTESVPNSAIPVENVQETDHEARGEAPVSGELVSPTDGTTPAAPVADTAEVTGGGDALAEGGVVGSALSRIPVDEASGEPMFEAVEKDLAWDGLVEAVGSEKDAADIALAQIEQANAELESLKKKTPTMKAPKLKGSPMAMAKAKKDAQAKYAEEVADYNQRLADTQKKVNAWTSILGVHRDRTSELRRQEEEERRRRDAELHDQAVAQFEEEQRLKAERDAEQAAIGTHAVNPKIKEKWDSAKKIEGNPDAITLPDGSTLRGRYVLTEAGAASASHDVNNAYEPTEGFPIDENGQSVNDRDYQRDKDAQRIVEQIAGAYDSRAMQTPVIVSRDGVVLSGNNRTMSGDLAARQGTDKAYTDYLREFGAKYGFSAEQVEGMEHPRLVFVPDEALPYDATTFSRFNAQEMKSQSKPEAAVRLGKIVPDNVFGDIVTDIAKYDRLSDYYKNEEETAHALGALMQAGVINDKQMPELRTGTALSAAGKELIENTLIGKVFQSSPDAVRQIISNPSVRQTVVMGLSEIANNRTLAKKGYDLSEELSAAVDLVSRAKAAMPDVYADGMPVSPFGRMQGLFDDEYGDSRVTDATTLLLADILNSGKPSDLRKILAMYNKQASEASAGAVDLFNESGRPYTKEEILTRVNELFRNATPKEQQALVESAIEERKRRAEAETGQRGGDTAGEQTPNASERGGESEPAATDQSAAVERPQAPLTEDKARKIAIFKRKFARENPDESSLRKAVEDCIARWEAWYEPGHEEKYRSSYLKYLAAKELLNGLSPAGPEKSRTPEEDASEAQKAAGNYKMEHRKVDGYNISIENPKGSVRRGKDADGTQWETSMQNDYGYIRGTQGVDGDHIDVFLSDTPEQGDVFVIDQLDKDGNFDEHKVMYGFPSEEAAREAYLSNYEPGWTGLGAITHVSKDEFKKWIGSSKRKTKPFAEYASVKPVDEEVNVPTTLQWSNERADNGEPFLIGTNGSIDLVEIEQDVFDKIGIAKAPFRLTPSMVNHVYERHKKELKLKSPEDAVDAILDVMNNFDHVRKGRDNTFIFSVEGTRSISARRAVTFVLEYDKGEWLGIKTVGYDRIPNLKEMTTLWEKGEGNSSTTGVAPANVSSEQPLQGNKTDGIASNQSTVISDGKVNTLSADKQAEIAESSEPYTITPAVYVGKSRGGKPGRETPMHRVTFNRPLTAEQERAVKAFANETMGEKKGRFATKRGWADRESADGSWLFRTEEDARKAGELIGNEEAVADAQPLTADELRDAVNPSEKPKEKKPAKPKKAPVNRVSVEDVMTDLSEKGETKLSDNAEPVRKEPETQYEISDDEMNSLADELRDLLGIGEDEGDRSIRFRDPGELTPQERQKIQSAGIRMAMGMIERGVTKFPDLATKMVAMLGDQIRPWLKSFYEGARWTPGYDKYEFTPSEEVAKFDVRNFDKPTYDAIKDAEMRVEERKALTAAEQAEKELKETRNKQRKENDKQREADTAALAGEAEAVGGEAEAVADSANDERAVAEASEKVDKTLDKINHQLAILGYFERKGEDPVAIAERKAAEAGADLAARLVDELGLNLTDLPKGVNVASADFGDNGGYVRINLPVQKGYEPLRIDIRFDRTDSGSLRLVELTSTLQRGDEQSYIIGADSKVWLVAPKYGELLETIKEQMGKYLPKEEKFEVPAHWHGKTIAELEQMLAEILPKSGSKMGKSFGMDKIARGLSKYIESRKAKEEAPAEAPKEKIVNGYKVGDEVMWDRYGNGKWEKVKIEDFDADGSPIFESVKGIMSEQGDWSRVKPADGIFGEARRVATKTQAERKKKSETSNDSDTKDATEKALEVLSGGKKTPAKKKKEIKPEQPVGDLFGGLFDYEPETPKTNEKRDGNKPSQEVAGGEHAHTVGNDETGTDGGVPSAGTEPTGKGGAADEKSARVERGTDGATHGTDADGGLQPRLGDWGRDEGDADSGSAGAAMERGGTAGEGTVSKRGADRGGEGLSEGEPATGSGRGSRTTAVKKPKKPEVRYTRNFRYDEQEGNEADSYTPSQRLEANVKAIETLAEVLFGGKPATEEQRAIMSRFRGWGQVDLGKYYDIDHILRNTYPSAPINRLAKAIQKLDPQGDKKLFDAIKRASLSSYYTPTPIARAMNTFLGLAGYKGGSLLDPSMGNGMYEGTLPKSIQERTAITGVELDWLSGQLSRMLYPDANVIIGGFEKSGIAPGSFDVVTSNVPFGDIVVNDPTWKNDATPLKRSAQNRIHNYYAVKMLEAARPGGLVAMLTTSAVMDTPSNQNIRAHIADQGEILGAIRLPDNTFQGTGVVTDILFIRKWRDDQDRAQTREDAAYKELEQAFLSHFEKTAPNKLDGKEEKVQLNGYFEKNPRNLIGEVQAGNQYGKRDAFGLTSKLSVDEIASEIEKAIKRIVGSRRGSIFNPTRTIREAQHAVREAYKGEGDWVSNGNLVIQDGKVGVLTAKKNEYGEVTRMFEAAKAAPSKKELERTEAMISVRSAMKKLIAGQIEGAKERNLAALRTELQKAYDNFVGKYGRLQDKENSFILDDIDGYTLQALERWKNGKFEGLSDIFTKNSIKPALKLDGKKTPQEAVALSLAEYGYLRPDYLAKALGEDWAEQCGDFVFLKPNSEDDYATRDEYLSGDVVSKLAEARAAAEKDKAFERNVKALEEVQPERIPFDDIAIHLGARWIPESILNDFVNDLFGIQAVRSNRNRRWDPEKKTYINDQKSGVRYIPETDSFEINIEKKELGGAAQDWETPRKTAKEILQAALEDKTLLIKYKDKEGNEHIDEEQTELANQKIADLRERFESWLPSDPERVETLEQTYNDRFNRTVIRHFDGSHLVVPGLMGKELRPHQKDAVWMLINNRGGIVDHIVGAGKTLVMQSAIMEMRRMGIAKKPMIVALKSTVSQIAREFKEAFPSARVLAPNDNDFKKENRKKFIANISLNDYDCIILSHEQYCMLPHTEEAERAVIDEQLWQLNNMIEYLYGTNDTSQMTKKQIKALEKRRNNLTATLEKRLDRNVDREFCFENLGVDYMFVDESHQFKSLPYVTSYQKVAGLGDAQGSSRAVALLTGIRHLQRMHQGDKGTVFLSGTTITNSLVEIYNLLNYLRPRKLAELGMPTFDAWASTFAVHTAELEAGVTGTFAMKDRFRSFDNVPELSQLYAEIADVRNDTNLKLPKPAVDGHTVIVPASNSMQEINAEIVKMLESKDGSFFGIHPKDPNRAPWGLHASTLSAKAAVSPRLIFPDMEDDGGKVHAVCENVKKFYDEQGEQRGVQLIFCEMGVPDKSKKYDAYTDMVNRFVNDYGIPRSEIAYIQEANTEEKRKDLFQRVRDGKVRILIGGTKNMGTGVNVQDRITDMHMLTVPWTPSALEQCIGRGARQGNLVARDFMGNKVRVHYYATEGSLDLYKYQLLDAKGKMFTQFKMGTVNGGRSFDEGSADEDGNIDPAEMVAILSGNPVIFERAKQEKVVKKLRALRNGFERDYQRKKAKYTELQAREERLARLVRLNERDRADLAREGFKPDDKGVYPTKFSVMEGYSRYGGRTFDKPKEGGEYLLKMLEDGKDVTLQGFGQRAKIVTVNEEGAGGLFSSYRVLQIGDGERDIKYTVRLSDDATAAGTAFRNLLKRIIDNGEVFKRDLDETKRQLAGMNIGDGVFPKQAELDEAVAKFKELNTEYNKLGKTSEKPDALKGKTRYMDPSSAKKEEITGTETSIELKAQKALELSECLGLPLNLNRTEEDLRTLPSGRHRRAWGFYSRKDELEGRPGVTINLPNLRTVRDVVKAVFHEGVWHKGIRLFCKTEQERDRLMDHLYENSSQEICRQIDAIEAEMYERDKDNLSRNEEFLKNQAKPGERIYAGSPLAVALAHVEAAQRKERGEYRRDATEEFGARVQEEVEEHGYEKMRADKLSFWKRVVEFMEKAMTRILRGMKIRTPWKYTRKEYQAMGSLFESKLREQAPEGPLREAEQIVKRYEKENAAEALQQEAQAAVWQEKAKALTETKKSPEDKTVAPKDWPSHAEAPGYVPSLPKNDSKVVKISENLKYLEEKIPKEGLGQNEMVYALAQSLGIEGDSGKSNYTKINIDGVGPTTVRISNHSAKTENFGRTGNNVGIVIKTNNHRFRPESGIDYVELMYYWDKVSGKAALQREIVSGLRHYIETGSFEKMPEPDRLNTSGAYRDALQGLEDKIFFRDPDMSLEEAITKMKVDAMAANKDSFEAKREAMKAIGGNLNKLRQAMARQRKYDITTVKSVSDLARILMEQGLLDDLSKYETKRILSAINNVVGKQDVSQYVQKVMDIMVDNQLRMGANTLGRLMSIRGNRVDARGIEVQGELDPEGQRIAQVVRKSTSLPKDDIDTRMAEAMNRMSSSDQAIADEAIIEYAGLAIARQYVENITESKAEEKALRESIKQAKEDKDAGQMTEDAYRQLVEATEDAIRQNKIERAESFYSLAEQLGGVLTESIERAKQWREAEKQRVEEIHHNANSDMTGRPTDEHHKDSRTQKIANNSALRFLLAPLATFDQMLRMFGGKSIRGEGYLWNRYMRGWVEAAEKEYTGYRDALKVLDAKVSEIYGKKMTWGDLFSIDRKLPKASVKFWDGGEMKEHELTQGNLLYIYMADKMSDGRMKLRRMGITEEDVDNIRNFLDPRFIALADWMQEEFLVEKRNEYNEVHKRMFGASMAAIENYFPLKILANARLENVDVADDTTDTALPATSTGSIIKRRRNNLALDVTGANAFSVILDHLQQMERWAAFAEFNRDLNTLLSYKRFRNQVMNMTSAYGAGKTLWNNFRNVCSMAAGAYRPPIAALDKAAVNIAKGVTAAKVSFRMFTALKQFLSMPAYASDSNPIHLAANIANPVGAWKWSMENLPLFEKRWKSRMAGDPRLLKSDMDWKMWRSRIVALASRVGMSPNAFVDALTVAIGTHAMYQTKKAKYLRWGMEEGDAEKRAKQDATILFNQTQQSSEGAFLSTMQVDRSWLSVLFTVFRNSSMSYTRQLYDAMRNLGHRMTPGYKDMSQEYMAKQMRRDGIDPDTADREAKREYRRGIIRDLVRVGIFGAALQLAWNLGAYLPYILLGNDDEEKNKMWDDVWTHTMFGSVEGLTGGDVMSAAGNMWASGEGNPAYLTKDMPLAADVLNILKKWDKDQVGTMNDVINLLVQSGLGVNPQSLTDATVAVMDFCGDDAQSARECALLITRILNCPQSQIDKIYFDELYANGEEASRMTPQEIAERFARYKVRRGAPLTGWAYGSETRETLMNKYRDRSKKLAKERIGRETDRQAGVNMADVMGEYETTKARVSEVNKVRKQDEERYFELLGTLENSPEFERYLIVRDYKREVDDLTKQWLRAKTTEERDSIAKSIVTLKREMLKEVSESQ